MKIKKMTGYFGGLEGRGLEPGEGLNILYAPNESGKSTWCALLRAMLYGVSTAQRAKAGQQPDKVKYLPWSGTPMSGSMDLETTAGPVTLRRWTEKANQPMQAFSATVTGTDIPVPGLTADTTGQTLLGVPREVFERSAFIRQSGLEISADSELDKRLMAIVSAGDEDISYTESAKLLKKWQRRRRDGKPGSIPALEARADEIRGTLNGLREDAMAIAALEDELSALETRRRAAEESRNDARQDRRKRTLAELAEARQDVRQLEDSVRQAETELSRAEAAAAATSFGDMGAEAASRRAQSDMTAAAALSRQADKKPSAGPALIPLAAALLAFALAVVLPRTALCATVGCAALVLFAVMLIRLRARRKARTDILARRQSILDAYGVEDPAAISGLLEEYRRLCGEKEQAASRLDRARQALAARQEEREAMETRALAELNFTEDDGDASAGREVAQLNDRIAALRERRAQAEGSARAIGDPMVLESEMQDCLRRRDALVRQEQALALALETLTEADAEMQQRFSPGLARRAAELFSRLTGGRYDEVTLARDLTARVRPTGDAVGRELDYLSAGARDQLYLALRLAVCELALPADDPCPLVLDDALVTFDSRRMADALALLKDIAQKRQVLLFTCHEREYRYFENDPTVTRLSVDEI